MDFVDVINYVFVAIMIGVAAVWVFLVKSMIKSFSHTPYLDKFEKNDHGKPRVSVILPARNEEDFIAECLKSLLNQDYDNFEIIVIDDSSEDATARIIAQYAVKDSRIIHVPARPKPEGWIGKNWACMEGYRKSTGDLLLFTDADTRHSYNIISLAVSHLLSLHLDALTVIPKMICLDKWTKITLPVLSTFLHTRFSALRVNDPKKKTGYFFGSFFIIRKETYDKVGRHEGVHSEIIEDGALGKKVKESGHRIRMVRGDHLVDAIWARDWPTLWNGLKRLMIPLYLQKIKIAVGIFIAVLFLLLIPYVFLIYSIVFFNASQSFSILFIASVVAASLVYSAGIIDARALQIRLKYSLVGPLGSFIVVAGFFCGMLQAKSDMAVSWRGREYSMKDHVQNSINV